MNNLEEIILEREQLWKRIQEYIKGDALSEELHKAEEHLHNFMLDLGRLLLQETVEHHGTGDIGETHTHSGIERRRYGERKKTYLSVFGQIEIRRTYYWEEEEGGFCPLDEKLNLPDRRMSYLLQGWIQKRAVEKSYDEAIEDIGELLDLPLPKRTQEQITREASEVVSSFYEEKSAPPPEKEGSVIGVEADGKGIRMIPVEQPPVEAANESKVRRERGEKPGIRRMAVATALFTFEPEPAHDRGDGEYFDAAAKRQRTGAGARGETTAARTRERGSTRSPQHSLRRDDGWEGDGHQRTGGASPSSRSHREETDCDFGRWGKITGEAISFDVSSRKIATSRRCVYIRYHACAGVSMECRNCSPWREESEKNPMGTPTNTGHSGRACQICYWWVKANLHSASTYIAATKSLAKDHYLF